MPVFLHQRDAHEDLLEILEPRLDQLSVALRPLGDQMPALTGSAEYEAVRAGRIVAHAAQKYLVPRQRNENGIKANQITIAVGAIPAGKVMLALVALPTVVVLWSFSYFNSREAERAEPSAD